MQAILQKFPQALDARASEELRHVASFLQTSPSMLKLQGLKSIALREVSPETCRRPHDVFTEVFCWTAWSTSSISLCMMDIDL